MTDQEDYYFKKYVIMSKGFEALQSRNIKLINQVEMLTVEVKELKKLLHKSEQDRLGIIKQLKNLKQKGLVPEKKSHLKRQRDELIVKLMNQNANSH